MKKRLPQRFVAFLAAIVFLLSGAGEAYGLHVCAIHNPEAPTRGHAQHHEHGAAEPVAADASHHHHQSNEAEPGHGPCTCKGACPSNAADSPAFQASVTFLVSYVEAPAVAALGDVEPLPGLIPHLFPYSQAPPTIG